MNRRISLMDEIRGFVIILVVIYHGLYSYQYIFGGNLDPVIPFIMNCVQSVGIIILIGISGISCTLSRNNVKRGVKTFLFGIAVTVVTYLFMPSEVILFGILHCLGLCMIIYGLAEKFLKKIPPTAGVIVSFALFFFTYNISRGYVGVGEIFKIYIPDSFYFSEVLAVVGLPSGSFASSDYYPLLPWIFVMFAGGFIGQMIKGKTLPEFCYNSHSKFLSFIGKHTLIIYLAHQPIIIGVLTLVMG